MQSWPVASVLGLLEEREAAARVRVEGLQVEADRILAGLGAAEAVLERRVIARAEPAEALAVGDDATDPPRLEARDPAPSVQAVKAPVAGATPVRRREGMTVEVLAPENRLFDSHQSRLTAPVGQVT
ncbi:hypothetical protein ACIQB5_48785 [Streptomyces sp. NPDC088560]|uniref:hypothetical protein n=1 Tax=Streptomyces sp. NPDC088560 TaxID=3365868 RepID=UPI00381A3EE2